MFLMDCFVFARYSASLKHTEYDNMFSTTSVAKHDEIKSKLMGPYSGRETDGMEPMYVLGEVVGPPTCGLPGLSPSARDQRGPIGLVHLVLAVPASRR